MMRRRYRNLDAFVYGMGSALDIGATSAAWPLASLGPRRSSDDDRRALQGDGDRVLQDLARAIEHARSSR